MPVDSRTDAWRLVVPVKPLAVAKSRLAAGTGPHRPDLALAFAVDTVSAALACPAVLSVLVVTDDPAVADVVHDVGAETARDPGGGLNRALAHGARLVAGLGPHAGVAALSADLPALRAHELGAVLAAAGGHRRAFLADAAGIGTTLLAVAPRTALAPAFGGESRARHAASGAREILLADVASVRRDVDTTADLREAARLGVGPRTAALLPLLPARA